MYIDTHAHLMFDKFKADLAEVISRAKEAGVEKIINIGCDLKSCEQAVKMLQDDEMFYATVGLHPYDSLDASEELMEKWEELIKDNKRIVAVGECGLDYVKAKVSKEDQEKAFRMHLELAEKVHLPVVIHNREADDDCMEILDDYRVHAVFHCYGGSAEFARKAWYKGYYTSFTGIITYPNAKELLEVIDEMPMDKFMIESDCPFLAPQSHRGERNEPSFIVEIAEKIAEVKNLNLHEIERISSENAMEFFTRLSK